MTHVLVVDDERAIRQALAINLRARDYDVTAVGDGVSEADLSAFRGWAETMVASPRTAAIISNILFIYRVVDQGEIILYFTDNRRSISPVGCYAAE